MSIQDRVNVTVSGPMKITEKKNQCPFCREFMQGQTVCPKCGMALENIRYIEISKNFDLKDCDPRMQDNDDIIKNVNDVLAVSDGRRYAEDFEFRNIYYTLTENNTDSGPVNIKGSLLAGVRVYYVADDDAPKESLALEQIIFRQQLDDKEHMQLVDKWIAEHPEEMIRRAVVKTHRFSDETSVSDMFCVYKKSDKIMMNMSEPGNTF